MRGLIKAVARGAVQVAFQTLGPDVHGELPLAFTGSDAAHVQMEVGRTRAPGEAGEC